MKKFKKVLKSLKKNPLLKLSIPLIINNAMNKTLAVLITYIAYVLPKQLVGFSISLSSLI